jgi:phosphoribosylformimino-5-aminoimidazole carboxamide ribotide isomerase
VSAFIIPVIDLLDGQVVLARGGRRDRYEPVRTTLCASAVPEHVLAAFLRLHRFPRVYIADLGAILGRRGHDDVLYRLREAHPGIEFWVDAGTRAPRHYSQRLRTVIGTETGVSADELAGLAGTDFVLSLDFGTRGFHGDPAVLADPRCWPREVILMHLPSVGAELGPDWTWLDEMVARAPDRHWYLAGGVRDSADLAAAAARGLRGALVATALHTGRLRPADFERKKTPA